MICPHCGRELWMSSEAQELEMDFSKRHWGIDRDGTQIAYPERYVKDLHVVYECQFCEAEYLWSRSTNKLKRTKEPVDLGVPA